MCCHETTCLLIKTSSGRAWDDCVRGSEHTRMNNLLHKSACVFFFCFFCACVSACILALCKHTCECVCLWSAGGVGWHRKGGDDRGCCNLWGYPCETSVEGREGESVIFCNYLIIVSLTISDCFVY